MRKFFEIVGMIVTGGVALGTLSAIGLIGYVTIYDKITEIKDEKAKKLKEEEMV